MTVTRGEPATRDPQLMDAIRERAASYTRPANVESTVETHVIKDHDLFMLTDSAGNVPAGNDQGLGVYLRDTRFLSAYDLRVNDVAPTLLYSTSEKNCLLSVELTNPDLEHDNAFIRSQTIGIHRSRLVRKGVYERLSFSNYGRERVDLSVSLSFGADFRDMFEVRGYKTRARRGEILPPETFDQEITLAYRGLDGVVRRTRILFREPPDRLQADEASFDLAIEPRQEVTIDLVIIPDEGETGTAGSSFDVARHELETSYNGWLRTLTNITTSSDLFDEMLRRSSLDLRLLLDDTEFGPVLMAGTPWFACVFGRDSLIAALQSLVLCPDLAKGTLRLLAHYQGRIDDPAREEEPGKIAHELRRGEMARLGEVPHDHYYGTVDATPLWLILLAETFRWTGDRSLVEDLWPAARRALEWIDCYGDRDGDGYVEYECRSRDGLINHGWKDSAVAVFHADGSLAEQPIALVEVQGYVYAAKRKMADLCDMRGDGALATRLRSDAESLRDRFNRDFWLEDEEFLAFALDGTKRCVRTITSNPGHALWAGIVDEQAAERMILRFKRSDLLSGWGVRCVSDQELGYNPMGYHLGTVWPHDVAFLVVGLRRYGFHREAEIIANQLYHAGLTFPYYRFPEVFTGFARTRAANPIPYPVACRPQAWAAGTPLLLLQSYLGIEPDAGNGRVRVSPTLPSWLREVRVSNLRVGGATLDLRFLAGNTASTAQVLGRDGKLDVLI